MTTGEVVRIAVLAYTLSVLLTFVLVYRTRPWGETAAGRWLMWTKLSAVVLLSSAVVGSVFPYALDVWVRTAGLGAYGLTSTGLLVTLLRTPDMDGQRGGGSESERVGQ